MLSVAIAPAHAALLAHLIRVGAQVARESGLRVPETVVAAYEYELRALALHHTAVVRRLARDAGDPAELLSSSEAADRVGVTKRAVTRAARAGRLPGAEMVGNCWLIPAEALPALKSTRRTEAEEAVR